MYVNPETLSNQSNPAPGLIELSPEQEKIYLQYNSFVKIIPDETEPTGYRVEPDTVEWEKWNASLPDPAIEAKSKKVKELSVACSNAIDAGTTVTMPDGSNKPFTYATVDQNNVSEMFNAVLLGATEYPYHANDGACVMFSAADIVTIYAALSIFKTGQTTYHNQLKQYVNSLTTVEDIEAVVYGEPLTGTYLAEYNRLMELAKAQLNSVLSKVQVVAKI